MDHTRHTCVVPRALIIQFDSHRASAERVHRRSTPLSANSKNRMLMTQVKRALQPLALAGAIVCFAVRFDPSVGRVGGITAIQSLEELCENCEDRLCPGKVRR